MTPLSEGEVSTKCYRGIIRGRGQTLVSYDTSCHISRLIVQLRCKWLYNPFLVYFEQKFLWQMHFTRCKWGKGQRQVSQGCHKGCWESKVAAFLCHMIYRCPLKDITKWYYSNFMPHFCSKFFVFTRRSESVLLHFLYFT